MSQIGYMFMAEGVGAYQPAVFHLMTHAFFKALLFLSSGSVILAMHHEQDIFKMGGLRKHIPFVFACMLFGTLASALTTGRATVEAPAVSVGKVPFGVAIAVGTLAQIVLAHNGWSLF